MLHLSLYDDATYAARISALPLIRPHSPSDHSDADSSDDDMERGRVLDHRASMASMMSTISMEDQEKMETLEKSNKELARKLMEAERTLSVRMADHENDLADMEAKIEEMRSELSATKREEKDLRGREVSISFGSLTRIALNRPLVFSSCRGHCRTRSREQKPR